MSVAPCHYIVGRGPSDRPWALFFLIIAVFSAIFPLFQAKRTIHKWTLFYMPLACFAVSVPLYMMGGVTRPILATIVIALGAGLLWRRYKSGWELPPAPEHELTEGG